MRDDDVSDVLSGRRSGGGGKAARGEVWGHAAGMGDGTEKYGMEVSVDSYGCGVCVAVDFTAREEKRLNERGRMRVWR